LYSAALAALWRLPASRHAVRAAGAGECGRKTPGQAQQGSSLALFSSVRTTQAQTHVMSSILPPMR